MAKYDQAYSKQKQAEFKQHAVPELDKTFRNKGNTNDDGTHIKYGMETGHEVNVGYAGGVDTPEDAKQYGINYRALITHPNSTRKLSSGTEIPKIHVVELGDNAKEVPSRLNEFFKGRHGLQAMTELHNGTYDETKQWEGRNPRGQ